MKIDYAVMSSDDSHYLDYWPVVSGAWRRMGICPKLFIVGERVLGADTVCLPVIPGVNTPLQGKLARLWAFKLLPGNCIISDIDMMPLSRKYFVETAEPFRQDQIVSYCADAAALFDGYHPMCYVLANAAVMYPLITQRTWEEFVLAVVKIGGQESCNADQWWLTKLLDSYDKVVSLKRGWKRSGSALNRLDRENWNYKPEDVTAGLFYDAHLLRPYALHKRNIETLVKAAKAEPTTKPSGGPIGSGIIL